MATGPLVGYRFLADTASSAIRTPIFRGLGETESEGPPGQVTIQVDDTSDAISYQSHRSAFTGGWGAFTEASGRHERTAHAAFRPGSRVTYAHPQCSRLVWRASTEPERGTAEIYLDAERIGTVDLHSADSIHDVVVFDSGPLPPGPHVLRIDVCGEFGTGHGTHPWVEVDRFEVEAMPGSPTRIGSNNGLIDYAGTWFDTDPPADGRCASQAGATATFSFTGTELRWVGSKQPDGGIAEVLLDQQLVATVDTFSAWAEYPVQLYDVVGLASGPHTIEIRVTGAGSAAATGTSIRINSFDCRPVPLSDAEDVAFSELALIKRGDKPYVHPGAWRPVAYAAVMPDTGVRLQADGAGRRGPIMTAFENNIDYIKYCFGLPQWVESPTFWDANWPDANEGRLLRGAGHSLRWIRDAELREIVDTIVAAAAARQALRSDGFAMTWPIEEMPDEGIIERANYDRAMWTRGMRAATLSGNRSAELIVRRFYDWFNAWAAERLTDSTHPRALLECGLGIQGHIGSTLAYFSPLGTEADLVAAERYYVQDYWLDLLAARHPSAIWQYPLDRPHSYLLTGGEALFDHYRATGAQKYLDGCLGMWDIFFEDFLFPGGGTAICEHYIHPPRSDRLGRRNNENCGSVFWIDFNARFLQLYPEQEKYANEIERSIYNICLANQEPDGHHRIRYFARMRGTKQVGTATTTCCEGQGTSLFGELPQYLYSVAADGIYVNLYESSTISWTHGQGAGSAVSLTTTTSFPFDTDVSHTIAIVEPSRLTVRIRVPSWATSSVRIDVNGTAAATGEPGSYAVIDREWSDGDLITYRLPTGLRLIRYRGVDCNPDRSPAGERYALLYGPLLYALVDAGDAPTLALTPDELLAGLTPGQMPLDFVIDGADPVTFRPYWLIDAETFSCFPTLAS